MLLRIAKGWEIAERLATPEDMFVSRRGVLMAMGMAAVGSAAGKAGASVAETNSSVERNPAYVLDRPITKELVATRYNNFREFADQKEMVWKQVDQFQTKPWTLQISGLVANAKTFDLDQLIRRMPLEERLYRHRCIEGWSMAVPWTGFPFRALLELAQPLAAARYVLMTSFFRPDEAPGQRVSGPHTWPMRAAITVAEASNELAFLVTGMYGHDLPKPNGAPLRLAVPWKYGFKSTKSIVSIEFTAEPPQNLWSEPGSAHHDFFSNVNPLDRGPRWSQARERVIGTWETRPTLPYNGYGKFVAHLYGGGSTR
jgi:sulfoxide reductase catalytic subunit YedY